MTTPTPIEEVKCPKCIHCKTTSAKKAGEWGQNLWISHYCKLHKLKTQHNYTCKEFKR